MLTEKWKEIQNYEGLYSISNLGNVKNSKGVILKPNITPKGYFRIQLYKNNKTKNYMVHRLVANAFIIKKDGKNQINHKNGIKTDNTISNLEWVTNSENQKHAYELGLKKPKVKHLVFCESLNIKTRGIDKMVEALKEKGYNANSGAIFNCINGKYKTHLGLIFSSEILESQTC